MQHIHELTFEELRRGLEGDSILAVDVREPHEFEAARIPGSVLAPLSSFDPADLPDAGGRRVVFSCAAGVRSAHAVAIAQGAGLAINAHYLGGLKEWAMRGGAVESGPPEAA